MICAARAARGRWWVGGRWGGELPACISTLLDSASTSGHGFVCGCRPLIVQSGGWRTTRERTSEQSAASHACVVIESPCSHSVRFGMCRSTLSHSPAASGRSARERCGSADGQSSSRVQRAHLMPPRWAARASDQYISCEKSISVTHGVGRVSHSTAFVISWLRSRSALRSALRRSHDEADAAASEQAPKSTRMARDVRTACGAARSQRASSAARCIGRGRDGRAPPQPRVRGA